jgi:hypothetical protein
MRHLIADWKRWSPAERIAAVALLAAVLPTPIAIPLLGGA